MRPRVKRGGPITPKALSSAQHIARGVVKSIHKSLGSLVTHEISENASLAIFGIVFTLSPCFRGGRWAATSPTINTAGAEIPLADANSWRAK
jgi:hypothetical protein